jgi:hypothetical protein
MIHKPNFFFAMSPFDSPDYKKKLKLWRLPHYKKFYGKDGVPPPLAQLYSCEREDFGQNIWDYNEVLFGTHWEPREHIENLLGTH